MLPAILADCPPGSERKDTLITTNPESSNPTVTPVTAAPNSNTDAKEATCQEADRLKGQAQSAAGNVAGTAKDEARAVQNAAMDQAKALAAKDKMN